MIQVWTGAGEGSLSAAGVLDKSGNSGTTFAYRPGALSGEAVSLTMPPRVQSWDQASGLAPIFDMNLPEGALRARLNRRFAKAAGRLDDLDLLAIVGRTQIGRIRYSGMEETVSEDVPFQSVDEILRARRSDGLYDYLLETFASHSGLGGVQPKVLIRDAQKLSPDKAQFSSSVMGATHIVKMWDANEYPQLAANEYFCLTAAKNLGFEIAPFELSGDGAALVMERFDLGPDGWLGFEDFCVLNAKTSGRKYDGSIETNLFKRLAQFNDAPDNLADSQTLFALIILNCALGNGDAHLKNFGLLYGGIDQPARLSPVYDLVTTTAYLPQDQMALTLDGSTRWPSQQRLIHLGRTYTALKEAKIKEIFDRTSSALMALRADVSAWFDNSSNPEIGAAMIARWEAWSVRQE